MYQLFTRLCSVQSPERNLLPSKKNVQIGAAVALSACLLHFLGASTIMFAIMIFALLSLYLYLQSLNQQILQLKNQFSLLYSAESEIQKTAGQAKAIPETKTFRTESQEGQEKYHTEKDAEVRLISRDGSNLVFRIQQLENSLNNKDETIKNLQNTLEVMAQRLDRSVSLIHQLAQLKDKFTSKEEIQGRLKDVNDRLEALPSLEKKINNMQAVCRDLQTAWTGEAEIEKRRDEMEKRLVPLIRQFEEKLTRAFQQTPDIKQVEQRLFKLESRIEMMPNIVKMLEKADIRLLDEDAKLKYLAQSVVDITDCLNTRIDSLEMTDEVSQESIPNKSDTIHQTTY